MCLILFSYNSHPDYKLILASNRDEFYNRPTEQAAFWGESGNILAGRDVKGGGTWLGVSREGKIAAITNYRDLEAVKNDAPSRGLLVSQYLQGDQKPGDYLSEISRQGQVYSGFNLLAGDLKELYYYSNMGGRLKRLTPGIYGLSNHLLDTPWPKVLKGKEGIQAVTRQADFDLNAVFDLLADPLSPMDNELPETGVGLEWERILSPLFIRSDIYGTRCSTVITIDYDSKVEFIERTFSSKGIMTEAFEMCFNIRC